MESIDHHCQLIGLFLANAFFHGAGMRAMRDTGWVQSDHPPGNMLAAHEIARYIVQHFIAVDITVVIRCRHRIGMVIVQARTKTAHLDIMGLESEVYWWWLVYTSSDWLKLVYAEW